jgi:hypothetical protein
MVPIGPTTNQVVEKGIEYLVELLISNIPKPLGQIPPSPHGEDQLEGDKEEETKRKLIRTPTLEGDKETRHELIPMNLFFPIRNTKEKNQPWLARDIVKVLRISHNLPNHPN